MKLIIATALLLSSMGAWAVNKCTGPDGKVSFQDAACPGTGQALQIKPASGSGKPAAPPPTAAPAATSAPEARQQTEAQRITAQVEASKAARRKTELETLLVPNAQSFVNSQISRCDAEIQALKNKKSLANNNLAGATWEASISSEMSAVAALCTEKNKAAKEQLDQLLTECRGLGGCKAL